MWKSTKPRDSKHRENTILPSSNLAIILGIDPHLIRVAAHAKVAQSALLAQHLADLLLHRPRRRPVVHLNYDHLGGQALPVVRGDHVELVPFDIDREEVDAARVCRASCS